jgi:protein SCO1/2
VKANGPAWFTSFCGALLLGFLLLPGCSRRSGDRAAANSSPKGYPLTGEVVSVDAARHKITVAHDAVAGLMPGMTMEFGVSAGDASSVHAGEHIRATLIADLKAPTLENIWPDERAAADAVAASQRKLREDTHDRGNGVYRDLGEAIPDFTLYDQDGRVVRSGRFLGKQVMLNFIYTRCPFANMCPASTMKMMAAQRLARAAGVRNIEFISITLDPAYDTPGVLREYADARGIDTGNFSFLTGPEGAIRDLLTQFGVIAEFQGANLPLKHTLATLLIDEHGRIVNRADGTDWDPADFVARMRKG